MTPRTIAATDRHRVQHHYQVERALADRLRTSTRAERLHLYRELYDELFQQVPGHPLMQPDRALRERVVAAQLAFLRPMISPGSVFMELGAGDCRLSAAMAPHVRTVYAVDVSAEITKQTTLPANCHLVISDGCTVPVPEGSVSLAFSDQLMEHLHPADAVEQLREIHRALAPGGVYVLFTPNRLSGPHDVSKYFDVVATGFHLKEYTTGELARALRQAGFSRVHVPLHGRGGVARFPSGPISAIERAVDWTPRRVSHWVAAHQPFKKFLGRVAAVK
ncbi:MAG: class I SAM-dependent methyltransferase [Acidobacteria bacterium]|nr:class I SAM-dependent methyltransferase [Acidobacteriota bacterium]